MASSSKSGSSRATRESSPPHGRPTCPMDSGGSLPHGRGSGPSLRRPAQHLTASGPLPALSPRLPLTRLHWTPRAHFRAVGPSQALCPPPAGRPQPLLPWRSRGLKGPRQLSLRRHRPAPRRLRPRTASFNSSPTTSSQKVRALSAFPGRTTTLPPHQLGLMHC